MEETREEGSRSSLSYAEVETGCFDSERLEGWEVGDLAGEAGEKVAEVNCGPVVRRNGDHQ